MSLISTKFATELNDKEMRDAYLSAQTRTHLSYQIRTIRSQRGWSQEDFAEKLNTSQSAVSRMEDRQYGKQNLQTLVQIANTFDCGLLVQFVPYDEFIRKTDDLSHEALEVPEFDRSALLPLSEDQMFSIDYAPAGSWQVVEFNANRLTSYFDIDPQAPWSNVFLHNQRLPVFHTAEALSDKDEKIARLEAEIARLRADLERRDDTQLVIVGVNPRPSQFSGLS